MEVTGVKINGKVPQNEELLAYTLEHHTIGTSAPYDRSSFVSVVGYYEVD